MRAQYNNDHRNCIITKILASVLQRHAQGISIRVNAGHVLPLNRINKRGVGGMVTSYIMPGQLRSD